MYVGSSKKNFFFDLIGCVHCNGVQIGPAGVDLGK